MQRALTIIESLHLISIVYVFDQAIYSKASEIKWKKPRNLGIQKKSDFMT